MSQQWKKRDPPPANTTSLLSQARQGRHRDSSPSPYVPSHSTNRAATWNGTPTSSSHPGYASPQRPSSSGGGRPPSQMAMNDPRYFVSNITSTKHNWSAPAREVIEQANQFPLATGSQLASLVRESETLPAVPRNAEQRKALGLPDFPEGDKCRQCVYCGCTKPWRSWQEHIAMCEQIYVEASRRLRDREKSAAKQRQQATIRQNALTSSYGSSGPPSSSSMSSTAGRAPMQQKLAKRFGR